MKNHGLIIAQDGYVRPIESRPTLEQMQALVGGYIELVGGNGRMVYDGESCEMIINENGIAEGLLPNPKATFLYHSICYPGTTVFVYGDVVLLFGDWRLK